MSLFCNSLAFICMEHHIQGLVLGLPKGKAAGFDLLTAEHLQFCHPIILNIIRLLFSLMISHRCVPDAFWLWNYCAIAKGLLQAFTYFCERLSRYYNLSNYF